jgi:hypothetical protein
MIAIHYRMPANPFVFCYTVSTNDKAFAIAHFDLIYPQVKILWIERINDGTRN